MLFKINAKSHKHPDIKLLPSESKTQLVNQRKQKVASNPGTAHSPEIHSNRMRWGAAPPTPNDTPAACIHTSYKRTHIENAYIYIPTQSPWTGTKATRRKHTIQPTGFGACSATRYQWDGEDVPAPWERSNSHLLFESKNHAMLKIRRSRDRLIFNIEINILVRRHLYIETAPRLTFKKWNKCIT